MITPAVLFASIKTLTADQQMRHNSVTLGEEKDTFKNLSVCDASGINGATNIRWRLDQLTTQLLLVFFLFHPYHCLSSTISYTSQSFHSQCLPPLIIGLARMSAAGAALHLGILLFTPSLIRHHMADPSTHCGQLSRTDSSAASIAQEIQARAQTLCFPLTTLPQCRNHDVS